MVAKGRQDHLDRVLFSNKIANINMLGKVYASIPFFVISGDQICSSSPSPK